MQYVGNKPKEIPKPIKEINMPISAWKHHCKQANEQLLHAYGFSPSYYRVSIVNADTNHINSQIWMKYLKHYVRMEKENIMCMPYASCHLLKKEKQKLVDKTWKCLSNIK